MKNAEITINATENLATVVEKGDYSKLPKIDRAIIVPFGNSYGRGENAGAMVNKFTIKITLRTEWEDYKRGVEYYANEILTKAGVKSLPSAYKTIEDAKAARKTLGKWGREAVAKKQSMSKKEALERVITLGNELLAAQKHIAKLEEMVAGK